MELNEKDSEFPRDLVDTASKTFKTTVMRSTNLRHTVTETDFEPELNPIPPAAGCKTHCFSPGMVFNLLSSL
jgi:hypothetical protein